MVLDYCNSSLKSLKVEDYVLDKTMSEKIRAVFMNLKSLELRNCKIDSSADTKSLFSECIHMVDLHVITCGTDLTSQALASHFPLLKRLTFTVKNLDLGLIESFIKNHNNLEELSLSIDSTDRKKNQSLLNVITESYSAKLKSMCLEGFIIDKTQVPQVMGLFSGLESLSLKKCKLVNVTPADRLFSGCQKIVRLEIGNMDNFFRTANKGDFPQLKYFEKDGDERDISPIKKFLDNHIDLAGKSMLVVII